MDLRRARVGDWLMGGFGAVLILSLSLDWYCLPAAGLEGGRGCTDGERVSGWEAFAIVDLVLLIAGLVGVLALVLTFVHRTPAVPIALTSLGALVAIVAAALAVVRVVSAPELPLSPGGAEEAPVRLVGAWLGAGTALGLVAAMLAAMRDERTPVPEPTGTEQSEAMRTLSLSAPDKASAGGARGSQPGGAA